MSEQFEHGAASGSEQPVVRHRRAQRYQDSAAENQAAQTLSSQETKTIPAAGQALARELDKVAPAAAKPAAGDQGRRLISELDQSAPRTVNRAQPRPGSNPVNTSAQGVPKPAVLQRAQNAAAGNSGEQRPFSVRREVPAGGRNAQNGGTRAMPRTPAPVNREITFPKRGEGEEPVRVRRPEEGQAAFPEDMSTMPTEPKKRNWLVALVIAVIAIALVVLALLLIPDGDGTLGRLKRTLTGSGSTATVAPMATAQDFTGAPTTGTAPMQVTFSLTTRGSVDNVRLVDEDGEPMTATVTPIDNSGVCVWVLNLYLQNAYEGKVSAQLLSGETWTDTDLAVALSVEGPVPTAQPVASVASAPEALDFSASNTRGEVPVSLDMTVTTTAVVEDVRLVKEDGGILDARANLLVDGQSERVWMLTVLMEEPYSGNVSVQLYHDGEWLNTEQMLALRITGPEGVATVAPTQAATQVMVTLSPSDTPAPQAGLSAFSTQAPAAEADAEPDASVPTPDPDDPGETAGDEAGDTGDAGDTADAADAADATASAEGTEGSSDSAEGTGDGTPARLVAQADESALPTLIKSSNVFQGSATKALSSYNRDLKQAVDMPDAENYTRRPFGVLAFRGSAFRQNAADGTLSAAPEELKILWTADMGSVKGSGKTVYYGAVYPSQPVIVKWSKEVRELSNITEEKQAVSGLREVIVAGDDGKIYFLDLTDGVATRKVINLGYPLRGTPMISTRGLPFMAVGQYARKMASGTGKVGLRYYNLLNQKAFDMIDGLDGKLNRPLNGVGYFNTGAVMDVNSDTLIAAGTNGALYLVYLKEVLDLNKQSMSVSPSTVLLTAKADGEKDADTAVESSLAAYQHYVFYADMGGVLRCVDTDTLTNIWAVKTDDAVQAAISLELEGDRLWLYTANTLQTRKTGACEIRRYDAMTGALDWQRDIAVAKPKNNPYISGAMASAVVGLNGLGDCVYYTLNGLTATQAEELGLGASAVPGALVALHKADGSVAWAFTLDSYSYSSPVAVYDDDGNGWLLQASNNGTLYLVDAEGQQVTSLALEGNISASPAVYKDILVIASTGKGTSHIYGIQLRTALTAAAEEAAAAAAEAAAAEAAEVTAAEDAPTENTAEEAPADTDDLPEEDPDLPGGEDEDMA